MAVTPAHAVNRQAVRVVTKLCYDVGMAPHRMLIHISRSEHRVLDPDDVCFRNGNEPVTHFRTSGLDIDRLLRPTHHNIGSA